LQGHRYAARHESVLEAQDGVKLDRVGRHAALAVLEVEEPDAVDRRRAAQRGEVRGGRGPAGALDGLPRRAHPCARRRRRTQRAIGGGELDDQRLVRVAAVSDHKVDVAVLLALHFEQGRQDPVGARLDAADARAEMLWRGEAAQVRDARAARREVHEVGARVAEDLHAPALDPTRPLRARLVRGRDERGEHRRRDGHPARERPHR